MTIIKTIITMAILLAIAGQAQASQQTFHWTASTGEVHHYEVCITIDGGECVTLAVEPTTNTVTLEFEDNVIYTVAVTAVDSNGHRSDQSDHSIPYAYTKPSQPGQPWRE